MDREIGRKKRQKYEARMMTATTKNEIKHNKHTEFIAEVILHDVK